MAHLATASSPPMRAPKGFAALSLDALFLKNS
jgi:hypothetical protein